jgi:hypothetical protein
MEECIIMDKESTEDIPDGGALVILTLYFFKIWHFSSERAMIFSYHMETGSGFYDRMTYDMSI